MRPRGRNTCDVRRVTREAKTAVLCPATKAARGTWPHGDFAPRGRRAYARTTAATGQKQRGTRRFSGSLEIASASAWMEHCRERVPFARSQEALDAPGSGSITARETTRDRDSRSRRAAPEPKRRSRRHKDPSGQRSGAGSSYTGPKQAAVSHSAMLCA